MPENVIKKGQPKNCPHFQYMYQFYCWLVAPQQSQLPLQIDVTV